MLFESHWAETGRLEELVGLVPPGLFKLCPEAAHPMLQLSVMRWWVF